MTTAKNEFFSNINIWLVREGGGCPMGGISFDGSDGGGFEKIHRIGGIRGHLTTHPHTPHYGKPWLETLY